MVRLLVLFSVLALVSGVVMAQSDTTIVIHKQANGTCGMPGSDASGNLIFGGLGNIQLVVDNASGSLQLICKGTGLTNLSGKAQHFTGFGCGVIDPDGSGFFTTDSEATISANGNGTLICRVPSESAGP